MKIQLDKSIPEDNQKVIKELVGKPLKAWILENYQDLEHFCRTYEITLYALKQILRGKQKADPQLQLRLEGEGFDVSVFDHYIETPIELEKITTPNDFQLVVGSLRRLIVRLDMMVYQHGNFAKNMEKERNQLVTERTNLKKKIADLVTENSAMSLKLQIQNHYPKWLRQIMKFYSNQITKNQK